LVNWPSDPSGRPEAGKLLVWDDPGTAGTKSEWLPEGVYNGALAVRVKDGAVVELISGGYHPGRGGELTVRSAAREGSRAVRLAAPEGKRQLLPVALAALDVKGVGDSTAVLARIEIRGEDYYRHELRLVTPAGEGKPVHLLDTTKSVPAVLAASPDGRFVAVTGFHDRRIEVYDAARLTTGRLVVQALRCDTNGHRKVAFLRGEKLWLGGAEAVGKDGLVLDLDPNVRAAVPSDAKVSLQIDAPVGGAEPKFLAPSAGSMFWRVVVTTNGAERTIQLTDRDRPTAAAVLPGKPAWAPRSARSSRWHATTAVRFESPSSTRRPAGRSPISSGRRARCGRSRSPQPARWSPRSEMRVPSPSGR
jgi:hypothetical protein